MQGLEQVLGSSGMDISSIAARFGISPNQAQSALGSLMPAVLGGFQKKVEANDVAPATDAVSDGTQPDTEAGNTILAHIFGSKDVSKQVADHAEGQSGVSSTVLRAMLPIVAAMVAKHLSGESGNTTDGATAGDASFGGIIGSMLGSSSGGSGLGGLLGGGGTSAGDNPLDQILARMR